MLKEQERRGTAGEERNDIRSIEKRLGKKEKMGERMGENEEIGKRKEREIGERMGEEKGDRKENRGRDEL